MATTKKQIKIALKKTFPAAEAAKLKKLMERNQWNALKAGVFIGVSPSVIESALNSREMRLVNVEKITYYLKLNKSL